MAATCTCRSGRTGGIITDATRYKGITHVVVVVGWGVDPQTKMEYWVVRNSFGTQWGELGYYRQEVGKDIYNMESHGCAWATPTHSKWSAGYPPHVVRDALLLCTVRRRSQRSMSGSHSISTSSAEKQSTCTTHGVSPSVTGH